VFGIHIIPERVIREIYVPVVGAIFPVSLLVCGMITPANLSESFQNTRPLDTHEAAKELLASRF